MIKIKIPCKTNLFLVMSFTKDMRNFEDFLLSYPFVPYQFKLISDVFDAFSKLGYVDKGVKNSERSILGITHYTIGKQAENNSIGYFVPFDAFFNGQFRKNLPIALCK